MGYVCVGYVWNGYVWDMCNVLDMCGICVVDTFEMDMCEICKMCWICVGYVWCEIRQQSSEEPCDETSFGKNNGQTREQKKRTYKIPYLTFHSQPTMPTSWGTLESLEPIPPTPKKNKNQKIHEPPLPMVKPSIPSIREATKGGEHCNRHLGTRKVPPFAILGIQELVGWLENVPKKMCGYNSMISKTQYGISFRSV